MAISRTFRPEPGGEVLRSKPLAGSLSADNDTTPCPAATLPRINKLETIWAAPKDADCTREQVISMGYCSMTSVSSALLVAPKTMVESAFNFQAEADTVLATDNGIQCMEWTPSPEQGDIFLRSDIEAGNPSINRSSPSLCDFMVNDTLGMAPRHAQFSVNCSKMSHHFNHSHSTRALSTDGLALDAFCSEKAGSFRIHKAPLLEQEQLLRLGCGWNMYGPERYVETMAHAGNQGLMKTTQSLDVESLPEVTEPVKQENASSSSSGTFLDIKYLSDLIAQMLPLLFYSTLVTVRLSHRAMRLAWDSTDKFVIDILASRDSKTVSQRRLSLV